jgi:DNA-binding response OmpR family regulator
MPGGGFGHENDSPQAPRHHPCCTCDAIDIMGGMMQHILLVEDDPDILELLGDALDNAGYHLSAVTSIAQATRLIDGGAVDMLITDIRLPDGNGATLAKNAQGRGIPALVITGNPHWVLALADGGLDYLHKPFRVWQVLDRVRARLGAAVEAAD